MVVDFGLSDPIMILWILLLDSHSPKFTFLQAINYAVVSQYKSVMIAQWDSSLSALPMARI